MFFAQKQRSDIIDEKEGSVKNLCSQAARDGVFVINNYFLSAGKQV
jgi:hypothetical protein